MEQKSNDNDENTGMVMMETPEKYNLKLLKLGKKVYAHIREPEAHYPEWIQELQHILSMDGQRKDDFYAAEAFELLDLSLEEKLLAVTLLYVELQTGMPMDTQEAFRLLSVNLLKRYRKSPAICFIQEKEGVSLSPVFISFMEGRFPKLPRGMTFRFFEGRRKEYDKKAEAAASDFMQKALDPAAADKRALVIRGAEKGGRQQFIEQLAGGFGMPVLWVKISEDPISLRDARELIECAILYGAFVCVDMAYDAYELLDWISGYIAFLAVVMDSDRIPLRETGYSYCEVYLGEAEQKCDSLVWMNVLKTGLTFDDLKLPAYQYRQLKDICHMISVRTKVLSEWGFSDRYSYGNGMSILFYGAPGTGKTMAAGVMAHELGLPLYRVDLSQLISKYIGETQKNIGKVFDEAEKKECVLLFDEADAIFAKRSDVSDAQDRYSNAETAYLLQRIEQYNGVSVLATNLLQNFDEAFRRRISYMVHFPLPDVSLRRELWEGIFPKEARIGEDFDALALSQAFELSGAAIKNAALHSAYMAMAEQEPIGMKHILQAVSNEYAKLGKTLSKAQTDLFRAYCPD